MNIISTHTGPITVNTYILHNGIDAAIIDPGGNEKRLLNFFNDNGIALKFIILTHGHFDHCGAVASMAKATGAKIYISAVDEAMLHDNVKSMASHFGYSYEACFADYILRQGNKIDLGFAVLDVIETPGHTEGSLCFICHSERCVFTGDTLFNCSIGRSDFPGGNYDDLISSVKNKLFVLPDDYKVFPGHGEETTIFQEKRENYWIN